MENSLPKGWVETTLESCCDILDSLRIPVNAEERAKRPGDVPYYGATGQVGWIDEFLFDEEIVLIGEDGAPFFDKSKKIAFKVTGKSWVNNHAHVVKANTATTNSFLEHYLNNFDYTGYVNGTTRLKLTQGKLKEIPVTIPPLAEQNRIVAKLDAMLARVANCKSRLEKVPAVLKNFRQSVLAAAVSGELTREWREKNSQRNSESLLKKIFEFKKKWAELEAKKGDGEAKRLLSRLKNEIKRCTAEDLPETWSFQTLFDVCHLVVDCHNKTAPYTDKGIYLVRTTNIKNGKIVLEDIRLVNEKTYAFWSRRCPPKSGDILFTREAPMGEAAIVPEGMKVCLGQRTMLLRMPAGLLENKYVLYSLLAPSMLQQINANAIGSGVKHLRVGDVEHLQIPVPPLEEQKEIVRKVEELFHFVDSIESRYQKAKVWFDKLPQAMLAKAFRGELVEQDENDEPASVLLERIKTVRQAEGDKKPKTNKSKPTAKRKKIYGGNEGVSLAAEE
jgi:type I restriction enzyme, S subunit